MLLAQANFRLQVHGHVEYRNCRPWIPGLGAPHVCGRNLAVFGVDVFFLSYLVAVPSAIKVFNWTATMYKGSITFSTPML